MTFLYPGFLWALLALAIPLIIHLFNFRRTQKVYFSNTRFIQQVQEATSSKRRLKHLLVLASRLLFIFFLVLVFAQPIIPAREQLRPGATVTLYVDNSQSMSASSTGGARAVDAAVTMARTIVQSFPTDTRYRLITNDFDPFSNSLKTGNEVLDQLAQLRLSGRKRSAQEVMNRFKHSDAVHEVFWLSDFQQSTFGNFLNQDTTQRFHLVPIQVENTSNLFVDTVYLKNPFAIGGERNTLSVRLYNDGEQERNQVTIRLVLDGLQSGTATTTLAANAFSEVSFELPASRRGVRKAVLSFADAPITFDNEMYAVIDFSDRFTVLEIKESSAKTVVETVFGNKTVFDFRSLNSKNVDYSQLERTDLLVLHELPRMDASLLLAIDNFLVSGGSLLVIPAAKPDVVSYRTIFPNVSESKQTQLVPLVKPDFNNPFFASIFQEHSGQVSMPAVRNSIDWGVDRQAILKQQDGRPFLSLIQTKGKVFVLGGPLQAEYGTFYNHALFVPVMYRIAASGKRHQQTLYHLVSQQLVNVPGDSLSANELLVLSGKQELTPAQRSTQQGFVLDLAGLDVSEGIYAARRGKDTVQWIAFNQDKTESKLKRLNETDLRAVFGENADVYTFDTTSTQAIAEAIKENYQGIPLWKYALVAALFFILMEVLLLRFWKS
ncbi:MAG: hypothetical protein HOP37_15025 [Cyclobacteriaceae bacterium]|nr:hypothetical protein [Cyclobacteriaceae bacterium]